ncbi:gephyrin-like molybdotransferase Glp [Actinomyces naeslundii]|uniref:molybdopterin molybdotransferase MoeA n=1 Tax=Actinomyces naeslundii TaxID=1655 RepID=UPI00096C7851|nr:gephyrin-like molybdotransferase Glp [Actinomyces naeslundii]OMG39055.1 molybdopterin molybdenumtransferase MoeA [Actinomyces naeslundii]
MAQMIPLEDYVARVLEAIVPLASTRVALGEAHGRILAEDVSAVVPVPPWTNSAMDGYAVRAAETSGASAQAPVVLPVAGDVPAGAAPTPLAPGSAQRIMTGAMLPEGADAVVKVEDTDQAPGPHPLPERVEIHAAAREGLNVRRVGENVRAGDPVMAAGTRLSAAAVSALASVGLGSVPVAARARVAVVSTGAELCDAGESLAPGTIPDSNGLLLAGLVSEHGADCVSVARSGDSAEELATVLRRAAAGADLVVTSGGVSAGAFDPLTMLAHADQREGAPVHLDFVKVAMQPGKPQGHGWVRADDGRRVPIICLPGNPVSVLVSFTTIVAPALARLADVDSSLPDLPGRPTLTARAAAAWLTPPGRRQHVPVRFTEPPTELVAGSVAGADAGYRIGAQPGPDAAPDAGVSWVTPTHRLGSGSHLVASLPAAQALAVVAAEVESVEVGDELPLIPLTDSCPSGRPVRVDAP